MMELLLRLERSPPFRGEGGIKPGMYNLPFHVLSNSILIIPPTPSHPPGGNQTKDG